MAKKLINRLTRTESNQQNSKVEPDVLRDYSVGAFLTDEENRTLWINGMPYGNAYISTATRQPKHAEVFNDFEHNKAEGHYSHVEGGTYVNTVYNNARITYHETPTNGYKYSVPHTSVLEKMVGVMTSSAMNIPLYVEINNENRLDPANKEIYVDSNNRIADNADTPAKVNVNIDSTELDSSQEVSYNTPKQTKYYIKSATSPTVGTDEKRYIYFNVATSFESATPVELPKSCNGKTMYFHYYYAYNGSDGWSEATKDGAHAEGISQAHGVMAHSEGFANRSYEDYSHSEGVGNEVYGLAAHAEGDRNIVTNSAPYSHAEGHMNVIKGDSGHAEGRNNLVDATGAHAEGGNNIVKGMYAHVEGQRTTAYGTGAHAEGVGTKTSNNGEHAEGRYNVSSNNYISSIGIGTETARKNAVTVLDDGRVFLASTSEEINNVYNDYNPCLYTGFKLSKNSKSLQNILANIEERMQNVTYAELKNLRDNYALTPGKFYRIIDFVTTVKMDLEEIKSAGHAFDIIVLALNNNILSENAYAMPKSENGYDLKAILYVDTIIENVIGTDGQPTGETTTSQKNVILGNSSGGSYNLYTYTVTNGIYCKNGDNTIDLSKYTWEEVDASKVIIDINNATPFSNYYELDISKVLTLKNEDGSKCFIYDYSSLKNKLNAETNTDIDNFNRYRFKRCTIDNSGSIKSIKSFIDEYIFPEIIDIANNEPVFLSEEYIKNSEYYYNDKYNLSVVPYNLHTWKLKYNVDGFQNIQNIAENYTYPEFLQFNAYSDYAFPNITGNNTVSPVKNTLTYYTKTNLNKDTITSNNNPNLWPITGFEDKELFKDYAYRWNIVNINGGELENDTFKDLCILTNFIEPASESDTRFKAALCKQDKVSIINGATNVNNCTITNYNNLAFLNTKTATPDEHIIKKYSNIYNCFNISTNGVYINEFGKEISNNTDKFVVSDCVYLCETRSSSTGTSNEQTSNPTEPEMAANNVNVSGPIKLSISVPVNNIGTINNSYSGKNYVNNPVQRSDDGTNVETENLQFLKINPENYTETIDNNSNYYVITNSTINNDNKLELSDAQIYYAPNTTTNSIVQLTKINNENQKGFVEFIYGKNNNFVNKIVYKYEETITEGSNTITSIKDAHFYIKTTNSATPEPIIFNNENIKNFIGENYLKNPVNITDESEPYVEDNDNMYYIYELLYIVENDKYIIVTPDVLNEKGISNQESSTKIIEAFEDKGINIKFFGSKYIIASFNGNDINMLNDTLYDAYIVDRDLPIVSVFNNDGIEYITDKGINNVYNIKSEYNLKNENICINTDKASVASNNGYTMYGALFNAKEITLNDNGTLYTYKLQHRKTPYDITVGSTNYTIHNFDLSNDIIKYKDVSYSSYLIEENANNTNAIIFSVNSKYNPFYDILTMFNNVISKSCIGICKFITSSTSGQYLYYTNPNEVTGQDSTSESAFFNYQPEINRYDYLELLSYIGSDTSNTTDGTFTFASAYISHYIPYYFSRGFIYEFVDEYNNYFQYDPTNIMYYRDGNWYYTFDKNGKDYLRTGTIRNNRFLYNGSKKEYNGVLIKNVFTVTGDVLLACLNNTFNNSGNILFNISNETSILNNTFNDIYNTTFTCDLIKDSIFSNFYNKTITTNQENVILNSLLLAEYDSDSTNNNIDKIIKPLFSLGNFRVFNNNISSIQTATNIYGGSQGTVTSVEGKNAIIEVTNDETFGVSEKQKDPNDNDWNYQYNSDNIKITFKITPKKNEIINDIDTYYVFPLVLNRYIDIGYICGYLYFTYTEHWFDGAKYAPDWKIKFNPKISVTGAIKTISDINIGYTNDNYVSNMSEGTTYRRVPVSRIAIDITKCTIDNNKAEIIEYKGQKYLRVYNDNSANPYPIELNIKFNNSTYYSGAQNDIRTTGAVAKIGNLTFSQTRPNFADELDRNETGIYNTSNYSGYVSDNHQIIIPENTPKINMAAYTTGNNESLIAVCSDGLIIKNSTNNYIISGVGNIDGAKRTFTKYNGNGGNETYQIASNSLHS